MPMSVNEAGADDFVAAINNFRDIFRLQYVVVDGDNVIVSNQDIRTLGHNLIVLQMQEDST
jgi:hypothetical protein